MKLNSFEIIINGEVKRLVNFHDGLNLIINKPNSGRTGNSVGKSTLSRIVDFLMLGDISSIYIDDEFKKPNKEIEALFKNNDVMVSLSFIGFDSNIHQISRNLSIAENRSQVFIVDGKSVDERDYDTFIQEKVFDIKTKRPSVRSVVPKFVRNDSHRMLNTTRFLDKHSGGKDYSELFLYLFGFSNTALLTEKRDANNLVSRRKRNSQSLNAMIKEQKPAIEIKRIKNDVMETEKNLLNFEFSQEYKNPIERLTELQSSENKFTTALLSVERKIVNIKQTLELLSRDDHGYLISELKAIYEFSGVAVDSALRKLEDVILFHSNLVDKKKQFLSVDMPRLLEEKEGLYAEINAIRKDKLKVFSDMQSKDSLDKITNKLKILSELKIELGKLEGLVEQQLKAKFDLQVAEADLNKIINEILLEIDNVYFFGETLNGFLKNITKDLYGEEYEMGIDFDKVSGLFSIEMKNSATNPEGGKKKAEVIAFDFAYIHAVNELSINRPRFVFHDSIEDIDKKQIKILFENSKLLPGQQILSMLSDKIDIETYNALTNNIILLLEEDEKFFGV